LRLDKSIQTLKLHSIQFIIDINKIYLPENKRRYALIQLNVMTTNTSEKKAALLKWLKKVGVWGFLFFLVKGLIWLAVGYWALK